jgi:hypothetical protein
LSKQTEPDVAVRGRVKLSVAAVVRWIVWKCEELLVSGGQEDAVKLVVVRWTRAI